MAATNGASLDSASASARPPHTTQSCCYADRRASLQKRPSESGRPGVHVHEERPSGARDGGARSSSARPRQHRRCRLHAGQHGPPCGHAGGSTADVPILRPEPAPERSKVPGIQRLDPVRGIPLSRPCCQHPACVVLPPRLAMSCHGHSQCGLCARARSVWWLFGSSSTGLHQPVGWVPGDRAPCRRTPLPTRSRNLPQQLRRALLSGAAAH